MKAVYNFVVTPVKSRYNNTKDIDGKELIVNTEIYNHQYVNREAVVKAIPTIGKTNIRVGDTVIVHHNVFKYYNDMQGKIQSGKSYFKDDLFFIDEEQYYAYHNGVEWNAIDRYCFIKPAPVEDSYIYKPLSEEPLIGIVKYPNEYLKSKGVTKGVKVCYKPESEYEFNIDGEKLYRMFDHQITMIL